MTVLLILTASLLAVNARPNEDIIIPQNVVIVPPNCPPGQQYINGQCRDVWRQDANEKNVVVVPPNCPVGQQFINGQCRDVWRQSDNDIYNVVTVPPNCPEGQEHINGECRDIWKNTGTVPSICPADQEYTDGQCRDVWSQGVMDTMNVVTVPANCPQGQEYINGQCRDVWIKRNEIDADYMSSKLSAFIQNWIESVKSQRNKRNADADEALPEIKNRNIISVPNQCPNGFRPDPLGNCRPIFD